MVNETFKREEFLRRKKGTRSQADVVAQQLTNIYRQLSILGEDATERYNQQLIRETNPDVLASLKTIPGGEEVRDYYNFLTHTETDDRDTSYLQTQESMINTLLPKPEQMSPIWESFGMMGIPGAGNRQNPIQMSVVNPIRASVITTPAPNTNSSNSSGSSQKQENQIDLKALRKDLEEAYEKKKNAIMQSLSLIIIDSNIEKMHQNLKNAIDTVNENLKTLRDDLDEIVDNARDQIAYKSNFFSSDDKPSVNKNNTARATDKFRKAKSKQKFSVETTEEDA